MLLYDFLYYWLHRAGHEVNILWAAHVVHHQSEDYNLSTALRQTSTGGLLGWIFYLPMALLGFPVSVFVGVALIDLLYQFWVHTEQIGKLGWFDRVFCSPSNHRAHHAVNDRYLDRNYGGILILWDRLFGTFVEEDDRDRPIYGTRSPLRSFNPLWANAEVYWATLVEARARGAGVTSCRYGSARRAGGLATWPSAIRSQRSTCAASGSIRSCPGGWHVYCLVQFALLLGMTTQFLALAATLRFAATGRLRAAAGGQPVGSGRPDGGASPCARVRGARACCPGAAALAAGSLVWGGRAGPAPGCGVRRGLRRERAVPAVAARRRPCASIGPAAVHRARLSVAPRPEGVSWIGRMDVQTGLNVRRV